MAPVGAMFAFLPVKSTEGRSSCVSGEAAPGADAGSLGDAWQLIGDAVAEMKTFAGHPECVHDAATATAELDQVADELREEFDAAADRDFAAADAAAARALLELERRSPLDDESDDESDDGDAAEPQTERRSDDVSIDVSVEEAWEAADDFRRVAAELAAFCTSLFL